MRRDDHVEIQHPTTREPWRCPAKVLDHYLDKGWTLPADSPVATVYDGQTVEQLKTELTARELPTGGNKADLVAALVADDTKEL